MQILPMPADAESVTSPGRIAQILERAREAGFEFHVTLRGCEEVWRTTISRVVEDQAALIFHQLTPATWQDYKLDSVEVHCRAPGCRLVFTAPLAPTDDAGICYFETAIPDSLLYHQLRSQFRVNLAWRDSHIRLAGEPHSAREGELINISEGGCRARLDGFDIDMTRGAILEGCRIRVADLLDLECNAEVCHSQPVGDHQELSLSFKDLSPAQRRQMQKCMATLQREGLRQSAVKQG